jgi:hypothetical protein
VPATDEDSAVLATLLALTAADRWRDDGALELRFDVHHPQGIVRHDGRWLISTVDVAQGQGWLLVADGDGRLVERVPCGDGDRFHPGGIGADAGGVWLAAAEYRPSSTTTVSHVAHGSTPEVHFRHPDHLGAIARHGDELIAWTWGSRELLRLDLAGNVLQRRRNPSHFVDYQDLHVLGTGHAVCSGVGRAMVRGEHRIGGLGVLRLDDLTWEAEVPMAAFSRRAASPSPTTPCTSTCPTDGSASTSCPTRARRRSSGGPPALTPPG